MSCRCFHETPRSRFSTDSESISISAGSSRSALTAGSGTCHSRWTDPHRTPVAQRAFADLAAITFDNLVERQEHRVGHFYFPCGVRHRLLPDCLIEDELASGALVPVMTRYPPPRPACLSSVRRDSISRERCGSSPNC
jgi:hypothetical protein